MVNRIGFFNNLAVITVALALFLGCKINTNVSGESGGGRPTNEIGAHLIVSGNATGIAGYCYQYTVTRKDSDNNDAPVSTDSTLNVTIEGGSIYEDSFCGQYSWRLCFGAA